MDVTLPHPQDPLALLATFPGTEQVMPGLRLAAEEVLRAMSQHRHMLLEAPADGTWRLSWLVPVVLEALHRSRPLLVVTPGPDRERELLTLELPRLQARLPMPFTFARVPPIRELVCLEQVDQTRAQLAQCEEAPSPVPRLAQSGDGASGKAADRAPATRTAHRSDERPPPFSKLSVADQKRLETIGEWSCTTGTGRLSELPRTVARVNRRACTVALEECFRDDCPFQCRCFYWREVGTLAGVSLLVCTFETLLSHLTRWQACQDDWLLEKPGRVVMEAADQFPDYARQKLGWKLSCEALRPRLRPLEAVLSQNSLKALWTTLRGFNARFARRFATKTFPIRLSGSPQNTQDLLEKLRSAGWACEHHARQAPFPPRYRLLARQLLGLAERLEAATTIGTATQVVTFGHGYPGGAELRCHPAKVDQVLAPLFDRASSVILTSPTLAVGGEMGFMRAELGVPPEGLAYVARLGRPCVNRPRVRTLLVVPELGKAEAFEKCDALLDLFTGLAEKVDGLTLGCFAVNEALQIQILHRRDVFRQPPLPDTGMDGRFDLLLSDTDRHGRFRGETPGVPETWRFPVGDDGLSCLVLDGLPLPAEDDPYQDLARAHHPRWFETHAVPRGMLRFRRLVTRLRRSKSERVVLVVPDRRILTLPQGPQFYDWIPALAISQSLEDVVPFLEGEERGERPGGGERSGEV